jgi:hypothetical protein
MKTSFKTGLLSVMFLFAAVISAQDKVAVFGVRTGINFSGTDGLPKDDNDMSPYAKVGFNIGVTADFRLSDEIYLLTGLEYTVKGAKGKVFIPEGPDNWGQYYPDHIFTSNENLGYLQMPLHVGYLWAINRDFRLMFHAGPYVAYALRGKTHRKSTYNDGTIEEETIDFFGIGVTNFDWGLGGGINVEYDRYVLGLGYDRGLRNIAPDYNDGKTRNMYITLGYLF